MKGHFHFVALKMNKQELFNINTIRKQRHYATTPPNPTKNEMSQDSKLNKTKNERNLFK